jgi:hypothetical protein
MQSVFFAVDFGRGFWFAFLAGSRLSIAGGLSASSVPRSSPENRSISRQFEPISLNSHEKWHREFSSKSSSKTFDQENQDSKDI